MWQETLRQTADKLESLGLPTETYCIPNYSGYASVVGKPTTDVYCLQALLGNSHVDPNYGAYAIAHLFDVENPSMAFITMAELHHETGAPPTDRIPVYNKRIDHTFSFKFLKTVHTAFNDLDPSGQQKGLLVQAYNARLTFDNFFNAIRATTHLLLRFKKDGQLAQIAVDFDDPIAVFITKLLKPLTSTRAVHYLPRTEAISDIKIPLRNLDGGAPFLIANNSTSLDEGFKIARQYFVNHYQGSAMELERW